MPANPGTLVKSRQRLGLSGLAGTKRLRARAYVVRVALLCWRNAASMNYTQGARRWDGIKLKKNGLKGQFPNYADCSSFATWILWVVLVNHFGLKKDIVNGTGWGWGYTGTLVKHGIQVKHRVNWRRGDLIFYGDPFGASGHVAVYIGLGLVISFGSQPGPFKLGWAYRNDFHSCPNRASLPHRGDLGAGSSTGSTSPLATTGGSHDRRLPLRLDHQHRSRSHREPRQLRGDDGQGTGREDGRPLAACSRAVQGRLRSRRSPARECDLDRSLGTTMEALLLGLQRSLGLRLDSRRLASDLRRPAQERVVREGDRLGS